LILILVCTGTLLWNSNLCFETVTLGNLCSFYNNYLKPICYITNCMRLYWHYQTWIFNIMSKCMIEIDTKWQKCSNVESKQCIASNAANSVSISWHFGMLYTFINYTFLTLWHYILYFQEHAKLISNDKYKNCTFNPENSNGSCLRTF